jgi:antitoxin (DNA-binding transcriptional repressor) of toxin-antitoxin stability system
MQNTGVKQLKDKLSHILKRVEKGEVIRVLRHRKHIVELRPINEGPERDLVDRLRDNNILGGGSGKIGTLKTVKNLREIR